MATDNLKCGDRVWCEDGRRAEFIAATPHGIVVRLGFYRPGDEEDEYYDAVSMVDRVFSEPPTKIIEDRIAELMQKETAARDALAEVRKSAFEAEREVKERMARLAKYPPLATLEALLEKRVTHFAIKKSYSETADIETFEEATTYEENEYGRKRRHVRMLALVGTGDLLEWKINEYGDGSGDWGADAWPCLSYEGALKIVTEICLEQCVRLESATPKGQIDGRHAYVVENAKKYGIAIPEWISEAVARARAGAVKKQVAEAEEKLAQIRAKAETAL